VLVRLRPRPGGLSSPRPFVGGPAVTEIASARGRAVRARTLQ
jgi:hypothetical protein